MRKRRAKWTVMQDNVLFSYLQPHMHLRGKDYEIRLIFPTGEQQTAFKGKWDSAAGVCVLQTDSGAEGDANSGDFALR